MEGLKDWLEAVYTARIPCAFVSTLDRRNMVEALDRMELSKYFQVSNIWEELKRTAYWYNDKPHLILDYTQRAEQKIFILGLSWPSII